MKQLKSLAAGNESGIFLFTGVVWHMRNADLKRPLYSIATSNGSTSIALRLHISRPPGILQVAYLHRPDDAYTNVSHPALCTCALKCLAWSITSRPQGDLDTSLDYVLPAYSFTPARSLCALKRPSRSISSRGAARAPSTSRYLYSPMLITIVCDEYEAKFCHALIQVRMNTFCMRIKFKPK